MRRVKPVKISARNSFTTAAYGAEWQAIKRALPLADKFCQCGSNHKLVRHHAIPVSRNGPHTLSNIEIKCKICHEKIHPHLQKRKIRQIKLPKLPR